MDRKILELNETTDDQLVIIREFNAPQKIVFEALTKHEHIVNWASPKGMEVTYSKGDLKVGSTYEYAMKSPNGPEMVLTGEYREIDPYNKLVYTQTYRGRDGTNSPETLISITLKQDGDKTQMIFHHTGFATKQGRDNASMGWPAAFDKLTEVINSMII